jgi:hypothetical protein
LVLFFIKRKERRACFAKAYSLATFLEKVAQKSAFHESLTPPSALLLTGAAQCTFKASFPSDWMRFGLPKLVVLLLASVPEAHKSIDGMSVRVP